MAEPTEWAELSKALIEKHVDLFWENAGKMLQKAKSELRYRLTNVFAGYLEAACEKYGVTKTILYKNEPVPLYEFYVPLDLKRAKGAIRSAGAKDIIGVGKFVLVTGIAGTGKSTFLKHIFLDSVKCCDRIPVFIELRILNSFKGDLLGLIRQTLQIGNFEAGEEFFERALIDGRLFLLLDGYDELNQESREPVRNAIFHLCDNYNKNAFVVSSRPDSEFNSWHRFRELQAMPLSKRQALDLVSRLDYDREVKTRFIEELDRTLYEEHTSFLSNPLLLTIMLMTYHENASIPAKRHIFYMQVFEALFNKHDALKEGYKRQLFSSLAMDDFAKVMAALSLQSYFAGQVSFEADTFREYLEGAKRITGLQFDEEAYVNDLLKSVCLLLKDGTRYVFIHRQFQEYFTAAFIAAAEKAAQKKLIRRLASDYRPNDVIRLLAEMDAQLMEELYFLPGIQSILKRAKCKAEELDLNALRLFALLFTTVNLDNVEDEADEKGEVDRVSMTIRSLADYEFVRYTTESFSGRVARVPRRREPGAYRQLVAELKRIEEEVGAPLRLPVAKAVSQKSLATAIQNSGWATIEDAEYLVHVRDFIKMRAATSKKTIDKLLVNSVRPARRVMRHSLPD